MRIAFEPYPRQELWSLGCEPAELHATIIVDWEVESLRLGGGKSLLNQVPWTGKSGLREVSSGGLI